jgi:hypothetical protein
MNKEALIILPGITATPEKRMFVKKYFCKCMNCDVYLPSIWQTLGIRGAAGQLQRFMNSRIVPSRYELVHFLTYISGGFILRHMLWRRPQPNVGRLVHVRSPIQEQVPGLVIKKQGRVAAFMIRGLMMFDLSAAWRNQLPFAMTRHPQGLIIEKGVTELAAELGLKAEDFDRWRNGSEFKVPAVDETWLAAESHDEVYTSHALLGRIASFFKTGKF